MIGKPQALFKTLNERWGPFHRDCLLILKIQNCIPFTQNMCPNSSGVNVFLYSWEQGVNYLVPPISLVGTTIKHLRFYERKGVSVAPYWVSASFWVYLCNENSRFKDFIKDYLIFKDSGRCVRQGLNKDCFIGSASFRNKILTLFIDFF